MAVEDTLEAYGFENWIPEHTQEMIRKFWNWHGGADDWRRDQKQQGESELAHHGPNPNGFQLPPHGATAEYFIQNWKLTKETGTEVYEIVKGRYVHRWNNMGSLIDENGKDWTVSTCDRWIRWFADTEERDRILGALNGR